MIDYQPNEQALYIQGLEPGEYRLQVIKYGCIVLEKPFSGQMFILHRSELQYEQTPLCGTFTIRILQSDGDMAAFERVTIPPIKRVHPRYDVSNILGTNYTPAGAVNQIQLWDTYEVLRPQVQRELAIASSLGMNSLRVFLHILPFQRDEQAFLHRLNQFVADCAAQNIRPLLVLFDDCWYGNESVVTEYTPIPGMHNGRWAKCPLLSQRNFQNYPLFYRYVTACVRQHSQDERVFGFDIWNEPKNTAMPDTLDTEFTEDLMLNAFNWARALEPSPALVCCWSGNHLGDIDNVHNYGSTEPPFGYYDGIGAYVDHERGTIVTEAGSRRWYHQPYGSPTDWIYWLEQRRAAGLPVPGVYLNWELMAGNSNCAWHWSSQKGDCYPPVPWCGYLFADGTPVHIAETETLRRYAGVAHSIQCFYGFSSPDEVALSDGYHIHVGTMGGELIHSRTNEDEITLPDMLVAPLTAQLYIRMHEDAYAGIYLGSTRVMLKPGEAILTLSEHTLCAKSPIVVGQDNNLKITYANNKITIWINNMTEPVFDCAVVTPNKSGQLTLFAKGNVYFDDVIAIKAQ